MSNPASPNRGGVAGSPTGAVDEGPGWVSPKRRARPTAIAVEPIRVSRQSGLDVNVAKGTFGRDDRFGNKLSHGNHSPWNDSFYRRNSQYKTKLEEPQNVSSLGIGERPKVTGTSVTDPRAIDRGPGSYDVVGALSASKARSPLDGPDYCCTTIKIKLGSSIMPTGSSPGPKYNIRSEDLSAHLPEYHKPKLSHGARHCAVEDREGPGPGQYNDDFKSIASSMSAPNLTRTSGERALEATGGTKRCVKSTFGESQRFPGARMNCSPKGDLYYAHNKFLNADDYLQSARSCSFGACGKVDFSNPYKGHINTVSPHTYSPAKGYSATMKTSPIDEMAERMPSPTFATSPGSRRARGASSSGRGKLQSGRGAAAEKAGAPEVIGT